MEKQEYQAAINSRVRLKTDGQDSLYPFACAGSEGWVRDLKYDEFGYPMIYIEWDKNHWAYNGEANRWTYDSHFDLIKEEKVSKEPEAKEAFMKMLAEFMEGYEAGSEEEKTEDIPEEESRGTSKKQYLKTLNSAFEEAKDADSFILITANRLDQDEDIPLLSPDYRASYQSPEGGMLLELQLAKFATYAMEELTIDAIKNVLGKKDGR